MGCGASGMWWHLPAAPQRSDKKAKRGVEKTVVFQALHTRSSLDDVSHHMRVFEDDQNSVILGCCSFTMYNCRRQNPQIRVDRVVCVRAD